MRKGCPNWLLVLVSCAAATNAAAQALVTYDTFDSNQISPAKWSRATMERRVEVPSGTLRVLQRDWADIGSNSGVEARSQSVSLSNGTLVTQVAATVRVAGYETVGCSADGGSASEGRARLFGTFFNTGNRVSGSMVGDMLAQVQVSRASNSTDGANVFQVRGSVFVCADTTCQNGSSIGSAPLGTTTLNATVKLQMEWDRANKRFVFSRDDGAFTGQVPYAQSDSAYPGSPVVAVGTRSSVANCTLSPRPRVLVDARFDQVKLNQSAIR